jgi:hypothetical protein
MRSYLVMNQEVGISHVTRAFIISHDQVNALTTFTQLSDHLGLPVNLHHVSCSDLGQINAVPAEPVYINGGNYVMLYNVLTVDLRPPAPAPAAIQAPVVSAPAPIQTPAKNTNNQPRQQQQQKPKAQALVEQPKPVIQPTTTSGEMNL